MLFLFEPPKVESVRIVPQTVGGDISFTVSVVPDVRLLAMCFLGSRFLEVFLRCVCGSMACFVHSRGLPCPDVMRPYYLPVAIAHPSFSDTR